MKQIITPLGNLALMPDTPVDISKNNPLFSAAEDFSINLTVPRGPNEHILGYRSRLPSATTPLTLDARFLFHGREKISGAIELVSASDDQYEILLKGSRNSFLFKYGPVRLHDIDFGEESFVPSIPFPTSEEFIAEMKNTLTQDRDWICFPCNIEDDYVHKTNPWDFNASQFIFSTSFAPYMRLWRALYRLFDHYGFTITDNWFTLTPERKNIVIYRKEHTEDPFLLIKEFYPNWTVSEFLSELENFFPVTFCIDNSQKTVRIIGDDTILTDTPAGRLDEYMTSKPKIIFNDTQNGYELKYNYPNDDDSVIQEVDYADQVIATDYNCVYDFPAAEKNGLMKRSIADGGYYKPVADGESWKWERAGSVAINVRSGDGDITRQTKIYPAMNQIARVTQDFNLLNPEGGTEVHPVKIFFQSPVCKGDGLYETGYYRVNNLRLMVYRGMDTPVRDPSGMQWEFDHPLTYPMANFVNHKMNGQQWPGQHLELRWDTDEGLRGAEAIAFLSGARKVSLTMVMHHAELDKIDLTKVYTLQGQRVMISELVVHYNRSEHVTIDATLLMQAK